MKIQDLINSNMKIELQNGVKIHFEALKNKDEYFVEEEKENGHNYIAKLSRCCIKKVEGIALKSENGIKEYEVEFDENGIMTEYSYALFCKIFENNEELFVELANKMETEDVLKYVKVYIKDTKDSKEFFSTFTTLDLVLYNFLYNLSYFTFADSIEIIASLKYEIEDEFRCKKEDRFESYGRSAEMAKKQHNIANFCNRQISDAPPTYKHKHKNIHFLTCPCSFQKDYIFALLDIENGYNKFGPFYIYNKKSYLDLSVKLTSVMKMIRSFLNEKEKEEIKKQQEKVKQQMKTRK